MFISCWVLEVLYIFCILIPYPKGNQPWIFIGRTDAEAEVPILWPPDAKRQLIGKDPDAGKDWRQEEKGTTEDKMVGWHHWFKGHEFEQTPGDGEGQGRLVRCSIWGHRIGLDLAINKNNPLLDMWFANIFSHSLGCIFTLLIVCFCTNF